MFVAGSISAQVVIRERVEVDAGAPAVTSAPGPTADAGFVPSGFVTPVSGQLLLYYERAERIFTPIPEKVYLTVLRNGDEIFAVDTFLTRLPDHLVSTQFIFDGCTGGFEYYDFHIYTNGSGEGALFEVGAVSAGDTLAFGYTSDNGTFGGDVVPLDPNDPENTIWLAQLGLYYSCIQQYIDFVRFSVAVVEEGPPQCFGDCPAPRVEVAYVNAPPSGELNISPEPQMPSVLLQARLVDPPDPSATVQFDWAFTVSYQMRSVCGSNARTGSATFVGTSSVQGSGWYQWEVPFNVESAETFAYSGINSSARGNLPGCGEVFGSWEAVNGWAPIAGGPGGGNPPPDHMEWSPIDDLNLAAPFVGTGLYSGRTTDDVFIAGTTSVEVTAHSGGGTFQPDEVPPALTILGVNPSASAIRAEVGEQMDLFTTIYLNMIRATATTDLEREVMAVLSHESHLRQFRDEIDWPDRGTDVCYDGTPIGYPCHNPSLAGYGLGQLDFFAPTEL